MYTYIWVSKLLIRQFILDIIAIWDYRVWDGYANTYKKVHE